MDGFFVAKFKKYADGPKIKKEIRNKNKQENEKDYQENFEVEEVGGNISKTNEGNIEEGNKAKNKKGKNKLKIQNVNVEEKVEEGVEQVSKDNNINQQNDVKTELLLKKRNKSQKKIKK